MIHRVERGHNIKTTHLKTAGRLQCSISVMFCCGPCPGVIAFLIVLRIQLQACTFKKRSSLEELQKCWSNHLHFLRKNLTKSIKKICCFLLLWTEHPNILKSSSSSPCKTHPGLFPKAFWSLTSALSPSPTSRSTLETWNVCVRFETPSSSVLVPQRVALRLLGLLLGGGRRGSKALRLHYLVGDQVFWVSLWTKTHTISVTLIQSIV